MYRVYIYRVDMYRGIEYTISIDTVWCLKYCTCGLNIGMKTCYRIYMMSTVLTLGINS